MNRKSIFVAPLLAALVLLAVAVPAMAAINWQIPLKPSSSYSTATGSAQYQAQTGQRDLQVEADHLKTLAGSRVSFYANGAKFGTGLVSSVGIAQIDRNTELGQKVPVITHGSTIAVRTAAGTLIVRGTF